MSYSVGGALIRYGKHRSSSNTSSSTTTPSSGAVPRDYQPQLREPRIVGLDASGISRHASESRANCRKAWTQESGLVSALYIGSQETYGCLK